MTSKLDVMFSSDRTDWGTPLDLIQKLSTVFTFGLDAAANEENHKFKNWLGPGSSLKEDGLIANWADFVKKDETVWLNPPYGRKLTPKWVNKALVEYEAGVNSVLLVPSRTETEWFSDALYAPALVLIKGRLRFEGAEHTAPFPSCLVIFDRLTDERFECLSKLGMVIKPCHDFRDYLD